MSVEYICRSCGTSFMYISGKVVGWNSDSSYDFCRTICRPPASSTDLALVLQTSFSCFGEREDESKVRTAMMCPTFGRTHRSTFRSSNSIFETRGSERAKFESCDEHDKLARTQEAPISLSFSKQLFIHRRERERAKWNGHDVSDAWSGAPGAPMFRSFHKTSNLQTCERQKPKIKQP